MIAAAVGRIAVKVVQFSIPRQFAISLHGLLRSFRGIEWWHLIMPWEQQSMPCIAAECDVGIATAAGSTASTKSTAVRTATNLRTKKALAHTPTSYVQKFRTSMATMPHHHYSFPTPTWIRLFRQASGRFSVSVAVPIKRWVVERTLAWISRNRRLARDFERYASTVAAVIRLAMIRIMLRRLSRSTGCP